MARPAVADVAGQARPVTRRFTGRTQDFHPGVFRHVGFDGTLPIVLTRTSGRRTGERRAVAVSHSPLHIHWFRWLEADPFSGSSLYACRCGIVRPGM